jgi:hypothetical protein
VSIAVKGRTPKHCVNRWNNHLRFKEKKFTPSGSSNSMKSSHDIINCPNSVDIKSLSADNLNSLSSNHTSEGGYDFMFIDRVTNKTIDGSSDPSNKRSTLDQSFSGLNQGVSDSRFRSGPWCEDEVKYRYLRTVMYT